MDGLEAVEILLSELLIDNNKFRIDDEMFSKEHINVKKRLNKNKAKQLIEMSTLITDFGAFSQTNFIEFLNEGILFLRNQDIKSNYINLSDNAYISKEVYDKLSLKLDENDILIPRVGSLGKSAVVKKEHLPCTANQNLAQIKISPEFSPYYVSTYLNTYYANVQINCLSTGNVQQWLNLENIGKIQVPIFNYNFQKCIETAALEAHNLMDNSKSLYSQAEQMLLNELGLADFVPSDEQVSVKNFSESFGTSGRLDAEYYQTKYDDLFQSLKLHACLPLGKTVSIKKSIEPGSEAYLDKGIPFIRVSNITKYELSQPDIHLDRAVYDINKLKPKKDTILLTKDGSVGIAYKVNSDLDAITSGALLHLTIKNKELLPDYLTLVLNSFIVKLQSDRDAGGSIIQHWKPSEIEQVIIPCLPMPIQNTIAEKIQKSFKLRSESKALLEKAKKAVEIAIEQDETAAMHFLDK